MEIYFGTEVSRGLRVSGLPVSEPAMGQRKTLCEYFNQNQIEMIERAIDRAWDVVRSSDTISEDEGRKLLAICVMAEARTGEENPIRLVNKAVTSFRAQREIPVTGTKRRA